MELSSPSFIQALIHLQNSIEQHSKAQGKGNSTLFVATGKTNKLWAELNGYILRYFKEEIISLYFRELANFLSSSEIIPMPGIQQKGREVRRERPGARYLCIDSRNYLEELYNPLICMLSIIKNNDKVFAFIVKMIDRAKDLDEATLAFLASEIVTFLLADFSSVENYAAHCIFLLKPLISV